MKSKGFQKGVVPWETKDLEVKLSLKDVDQKKGIVMFYGAIFNNLDGDRDIIRPGAFKKTIAERGPEGSNLIKHLNQHDSMQPLSHPSVLREDKTGLYVESTISKTTWGKDVLILYADEVIDNHSIGYRTEKSIRDEANETRELIEVKLWEVSTVSFGANELTRVVGMKGQDAIDRLARQMDRLQRALKKELSDESAEMLEIELAKFQRAFAELEKKNPPDEPEENSTDGPGKEVLKMLSQGLRESTKLITQN